MSRDQGDKIYIIGFLNDKRHYAKLIEAYKNWDEISAKGYTSGEQYFIDVFGGKAKYKSEAQSLGYSLDEAIKSRDKCLARGIEIYYTASGAPFWFKAYKQKREQAKSLIDAAFAPETA